MSAPVARKPAEVADLRLHLREQWQPGRPFHRIAARSHCTTGSPSDYALWEHRELGEATLWWVAADMVELLVASAPSVPDAVRLPELPCPAERGLVVFERPWSGSDSEIAGGHVEVDAVMWGRGLLPPLPDRGRVAPAPTVGISSYRRVIFDEGLWASEIELALRSGLMKRAIAQPIVRGSGLAAYSLHGCEWLPLGRSEWPVSDELGVPPLNRMPDHQVASYLEDRRMLAALWTLLAQEGIAQTQVQRPERQAVRRTMRAGLSSAIAEVRVVNIRQTRGHSAGGGTSEQRDWSHRWLVSGHWRHQPVGRRRQDRRLTWISPHVKGPADKPLVVKEVVHALRADAPSDRPRGVPR